MSEFDDGKSSWRGLAEALLDGKSAEPKSFRLVMHAVRSSVYGQQQAQIEPQIVNENNETLVSLGKFWVSAGGTLNICDIHRTFNVTIS